MDAILSLRPTPPLGGPHHPDRRWRWCLGIDNLIFISILSNKLPEGRAQKARRLGITLALVMRLALLSTLAWLVHLTEPIFLGNSVGALDLTFSWRDLILIAGGLFLLWKATKEIHGAVDPSLTDVPRQDRRSRHELSAAIFQIILIDMVFSVDLHPDRGRA
jgi:predicted tellurium resistance membrane protein TerC